MLRPVFSRGSTLALVPPSARASALALVPPFARSESAPSVGRGPPLVSNGAALVAVVSEIGSVWEVTGSLGMSCFCLSKTFSQKPVNHHSEGLAATR